MTSRFLRGGGGGQWFCYDSTKALVIKTKNRDEGGGGFWQKKILVFSKNSNNILIGSARLGGRLLPSPADAHGFIEKGLKGKTKSLP